jgi:hypothetical protein
VTERQLSELKGKLIWKLLWRKLWQMFSDILQDKVIFNFFLDNEHCFFLKTFFSRSYTVSCTIHWIV